MQTPEAKFFQFLDGRNFEEAQSLLPTIAEGTSYRLRKQGHYYAQIAMRQGLYDEALQRLDLTAAAYGPHVGILSDRLTCFYCLDDKLSWRAAFAELLAEYSKAQTQLSLDSQFKTRIVLAKGFEELGEVSRALEMFQIFNGDPLLETMRPRTRQMFLSNLLRLKALMGDREGIGSLYVQLSHFEKDNSSQYDRIEIQHALMMADSELVGLHAATQRALGILQESELDEHDRGLVTFDLLEAALIKGEKLLDERILTQAAGTSFEKCLLAIQKNESPISNLTVFESKLSLSEHLRLLTCLLSRTENLSQRDELRAKFELLISSLSEASQDSWRQRLLRKQQVSVLLDFEKGRLQVAAKVITLKKNSLPLFLLSKLVTNKDVKLDDLAKELGEHEMTESFHTRIRVALYRLNNLLEDHGVPQVGFITKSFLHRSPYVTITKI